MDTYTTPWSHSWSYFGPYSLMYCEVLIHRLKFCSYILSTQAMLQDVPGSDHRNKQWFVKNTEMPMRCCMWCLRFNTNCWHTRSLSALQDGSIMLVPAWKHNRSTDSALFTTETMLTLSCSACSSLVWFCSLDDLSESFLFSSSRLLCSTYLDDRSTTTSYQRQTHLDWKPSLFFFLSYMSTFGLLWLWVHPHDNTVWQREGDNFSVLWRFYNPLI